MYTNYSFSQESLTSDFYFPIHQEIIDSLLQGDTEGISKNALADFSIIQPYKTSINGIALEFEYAYKLLPSEKMGVQARFSATIQNLKVAIDAVSTQDRVREQAGGIFLDIDIQGQCRNLNLSLSQKMINLSGDLIVTSGVSNQPSVLVNLDPYAIPSDWDFHAHSCLGPAGYEAGVRQAILDFIANNQNTLRGLVADEVNGVANQAFDSILQKVMAPQTVDINEHVKMVFAPEKLEYQEALESFILKGLVSTNLASGIATQQHTPYVWDSGQQNELKTGLIISQAYLQKVAHSLQKNGDLRMTLESQKNKSFRRLHGSRFLQFFVFPDLMKFGKHENFLLDTYLTKPPEIAFYNQSERFSWFSVNAAIKIDLKAPKDDEHVPYMYYRMPTELKAWLTVHNQQLVIGVANPKSQFKASWDSNYLKQYSTNKRFASKTFQMGFMGALKEQRFKIDLPKIEFQGIPPLVPLRINANTDSVQLIYGTIGHQ